MSQPAWRPAPSAWPAQPGQSGWPQPAAYAARPGYPPQPGYTQPGYPQPGPPQQPGYPPRPAAPQAWPGQQRGPIPGPAALPTRRSPLRLVLLALVGVTLLALAGLVVSGLTSKPAEVAYQNRDYQVPPVDLNPPTIPIPQSLDQAKQWTTANALYNQKMPAPIRCDIQPIDVQTADDALLKSHFEAFVECLVRAWQPPLTAAGFQIFRPSVTIYGSTVSTKCGGGDDMSHNAFYCGADQQIFWSRTLGGDLNPPSVDKWAGDEVMAHEFGHAVQGRSGILAAYSMQRHQENNKSAALELSRRSETQADCFAGLLLRSVSHDLKLTNADIAAIEQGFASSGDDVITGQADYEGDHGLARSRKYWGILGLGTDTVGSCNTWVAPASYVR